MNPLNKLFVCKNCGYSIAPQLDRLDKIERKLKLLQETIKEFKQELESFEIDKVRKR